ncbi:MAG: purine-nucleoside phosphorylase [Thermoguttaceae bacterium]|nr:purine-nucleoside phosphorylase [Thermoguttaceae bacterium]
MTEYDMIQEAVATIRARWSKQADVGIILGTGLGALADRISADATIPYEEIPHFARSTVESHAGRLILGSLEGKTVVAMQGRFHYYEGFSPKQIVFPVRVMRALGAKTLIVSNACGGLNPQFRAGDLMLIEDHINLQGMNPLIGPNDDRLGARFPDMIEPYSRRLLELARDTALSKGIPTHTGVYVAVAGPNLETRAEYRFLRALGADAVGMSTVPEVLAAVHMNMRVLGISCVTDMGLPDALEPASLPRILDNAAKAEPKMNEIICGVLKKI